MLAASVYMEIVCPSGLPPAGLNTEFMVCSCGRKVGLVNLCLSMIE